MHCMISLSLSDSRSFLPRSLCLSVYAFAGGVDCAAFMIHLSTSSVKSQCSAYILYLYIQKQQQCLVVACCWGVKSIGKQLDLLLFFLYFPMLLGGLPKDSRTSERKRRPNTPPTLCVSSSSALGKNVSATPNISWVRRRVGAKNWVNFCLSCCFSCSFCACWSSSKINKKKPHIVDFTIYSCMYLCGCVCVCTGNILCVSDDDEFQLQCRS